MCKKEKLGFYLGEKQNWNLKKKTDIIFKLTVEKSVQYF